MAYNSQTSIPLSFQTGEDLSRDQYTFVKLNSSGLVVGSDKTSFSLGVLTNQPSSAIQGQYAATVDVVGVTKIVVGGVYPVGTFLVPGAMDGTKMLGMSVADASSNCKYIRAMTLQASTAYYDVVSCLLISPNPGTDSTVVS